MKAYSMLLVGLVTSCRFGASERCSTSKVLTQIRPGAAWVKQADSMKALKWLDTKQSKPSNAEVEKAKQACIADMQSRDARKAQARLELKNSSTPTDKKVEDLILLLDLDQ